MRAQRPWNRWRSAPDVDRYLAAQIDPRQLVVFHLRDDQSVSDEYQRGGEAHRWFGAHADGAVFAKLKRLARAVPHEREGGLLLDDSPRAKLHRLDVAGIAGRLEAAALEFARDVFRGAAVARAAGFTAFQLVV